MCFYNCIDAETGRDTKFHVLLNGKLVILFGGFIWTAGPGNGLSSGCLDI